ERKAEKAGAKGLKNKAAKKKKLNGHAVGKANGRARV
ncbi:MAG: SET domain-containing protein-lysine N-methyltransferase, partial [Bradyrhizobium sp.]|nr:SET domain-containing protein-lysine N-methyltransferase [Bradyrhizobium sp.]